MKKRLYLVIGSVLVFLLMSFILIEIGLRIILFTDVPASILGNISLLEKHRNPRSYADPFPEDDYWKLLHYLGKRKDCHGKPHPVLGWIDDNFFPDTYIHNKIRLIPDYSG